MIPALPVADARVGGARDQVQRLRRAAARLWMPRDQQAKEDTVSETQQETNGTNGQGALVHQRPVGMARLATALAKAQGEFPDIERTRHVVVKGDKANYEFDYAPLDAILRACRPAMAKHGLSLNHRIDTSNSRCITVIAVLMHESGEYQECALTFPHDYARVQQLGSLVTYLKRYSAESILGVCAEQDDDGNAADGNRREMSDRQPQPARSVEQMITEDQDKEIGSLFKSLKIARTQATTICREVTGKDPAHLTRADADKLIEDLKARATS